MGSRGPLPSASVRRRNARPGSTVGVPVGRPSMPRKLTGEASVWEALHTTGIRGSELVVDRLAPIDVDSPEDLKRARSRVE